MPIFFVPAFEFFIYGRLAHFGVDLMKELAAKRNDVIPEEEPIWPDDEDEMAKILGLA